MRWVDGSEIEPKHFSGEEICEKLALEMWDNDHNNKDAEILIEARHIDSYYQKLLDCTEDKNESDRVYDEFSERGFIFLLMLFIPNIIWTKNLPEGI